MVYTVRLEKMEPTSDGGRQIIQAPHNVTKHIHLQAETAAEAERVVADILDTTGQKLDWHVAAFGGNPGKGGNMSAYALYDVDSSDINGNVTYYLDLKTIWDRNLTSVQKNFKSVDLFEEAVAYGHSWQHEKSEKILSCFGKNPSFGKTGTFKCKKIDIY